MRKILLCLLPVLAVASSPAHADDVGSVAKRALRLTRAKRDLYKSADGSTVVATERCTSSASRKPARIDGPDADGRMWVVFLDEQGAEEDHCRATAVVRKVASR